MRRSSDSTMATGPWHPGWRTLRGLVLLVVVPAWTVPASPIKHHRLAARSDPEIRAWNKFLAGGPAHWSHARPPEITARIHVLMHKSMRSSDPISDLNVEYLMWRRSLDPVRF